MIQNELFNNRKGFKILGLCKSIHEATTTCDMILLYGTSHCFSRDQCFFGLVVDQSRVIPFGLESGLSPFLT